jgi:hypothetical protein
MDKVRRERRCDKPGRRVAMAPQALVKNSKKYGGQYVATRSFTDRNVVTSGPDLVAVHKEAVKKGIKEPVVFYVPKKGAVHIY